MLVGIIGLVPSPPLRADPRYLIYLALAAGFLGGVSDVRDAVNVGERHLPQLLRLVRWRNGSP